MISMTSRNRKVASAASIGLTVLLALAISAGFSLGGRAARAAADDKAAAEALKALQGTWVSTDADIEAKWTFEGETLKATVNGDEYTCKVKLDHAAKPHATIDFAIEEGPEDYKGKKSKAIYKLDGAKLTICVGHPGKDRPKEFEHVEDEAYLYKLKKQKKE
jgi:uncharacterized protein (TIGR03067 family)